MNYSEDRIKHFWEWFIKNYDRLSKYKKDQSNIFKDISHNLKLINKNLTFVIGSQKNGAKDFIISANGIKEYFPIVQSIVEKAPKLNDWKFIALKPRLGVFPVNYEGLLIDPKDIVFDYKIRNNKINLQLFINGFKPDDKRYKGVAFILLDNALGEYDVATKIGNIDFEKFSANETKNRCLPFEDIVKLFDSTY